ncbi:nagb/rpia/CoA transferase-like protein [Polychaeton citri CBS 116435]|uniref:Translation initiation factor eIF2B subunit beta n=1 Tax=Polychaeton citri CBS 116435 TaxID=1314669 RepID=A0A9P4Q7P6_9PEZI|nr:nagb/rpia/CoA transferase-like protein [Polychaeton citri CBS 116435]
MPSVVPGQTPSLSTFLKSLKTNDIDSSVDLLISLLKRRQIRSSRPCAIATTQLMLRVVANERIKEASSLIQRVRDVGRRLIAAQPREMAVGNIVRRVLGVVREVAERDDDGAASSDFASSTPGTPGSVAQTGNATLGRPAVSVNIPTLSPLSQGAALPEDVQTGREPVMSGSTSPSGAGKDQLRPALGSVSSYAGGQAPPQIGSLFGIFQSPATGLSPAGTPPVGGSPAIKPMQKATKDEASKEKLDIKAEVIDGIKELLDELEIVDSQIAESALDHIHSNELILTHTSSQTVQKFLTTAARKRKFTVVHAEAYPNDHETTHATIVNGNKKTTNEDEEEVNERWKPLTSMGITVILIPDTAVFALMSRINKVILAPHTVLANGSLIAAAGASTIAQAAQAHRVPVVVLSGVYKLSPVYPFDTDELVEYGDPGKVVAFQEGEFVEGVEVVNPIYDYVDADLVDLYITNLGGCAPSFLYRIVADHYDNKDINLNVKST